MVLHDLREIKVKLNLYYYTGEVLCYWNKLMGGDIGEIKLGSDRELYKNINHYVVVKREKEEQ